MVQVKTFYAYNELRNYSYLIFNDESGAAWVIDPYEAAPIIDYIKNNGLVLQGILNTHQHHDHICGNGPLIETFGTSVRKLKGSDHIQLSHDYEIEALDTPGHTIDHQAFVWKDKGQVLALFSGDTLFNSGVGNCRGGGDVNLLYETTERLVQNLPASTLLYPGHDYRQKNLEFAKFWEPENHKIDENLKLIAGHATEDFSPNSLGDELMVNPFLRLNSTELRQKVLNDSQSLKSRKELFIKLRQLRDQW